MRINGAANHNQVIVTFDKSTSTAPYASLNNKFEISMRDCPDAESAESCVKVIFDSHFHVIIFQLKAH